MNINDIFFNLLNTKLEELGVNKKTLATKQYKSKITSLKGNNKAINNEHQIIRNKNILR